MSETPLGSKIALEIAATEDTPEGFVRVIYFQEDPDTGALFVVDIIQYQPEFALNALSKVNEIAANDTGEHPSCKLTTVNVLDSNGLIAELTATHPSFEANLNAIFQNALSAMFGS